MHHSASETNDILIREHTLGGLKNMGPMVVFVGGMLAVDFVAGFVEFRS